MGAGRVGVEHGVVSEVVEGIGGEMAGELEAMGFPRDWCERAVGMSGGIEPAVELLLQWQAEGALPGGGGEGAAPASSSPPAVSTVTSAVSSPAGLDAVVPDAGVDERNCCRNAAETVQGVESDKKDARSRDRVAATAVAASGSSCRDDMSAAPVELQIRCSGYLTIKGTFSAGSTLKEVRDFVVRELQTQQLEQPVGMPSSGGTNRQSRRTLRSNGISASLPSDRVTQRTRKMSRYANPSSSASAPRNVVIGNMCFLIPFPRMVFDTEASMETTLFDANLYPRGILTVQFQNKEGPSTSDHVNKPHESSNPLGEDLQARNRPTSIAQPSGDHHVSRHAEDVAMREQRLKATLDRYSSEQGSRNVTNGVLEGRVAVASMLAPTATSSAVASVPRSREARTLEMDGERVRHRELALQAAAKRMTEAAQIFREGFMPDDGEPLGGFCMPSDVQPVPATTGNDDLTRIVLEDQDSKGKQVADCGPSSPTSQLAEVRVHDLGSNFAGFRGRPSRARLPLPSPSPSRPEKMQRTDEASSTSSAVANHVPPLFASGHVIERALRRGEETSPSGRWIRGSFGSGSSSVSELRIRLEDGSVLRHTFPAYTTLQSVCEFALPGRFSTAEYGLILPMPGSHFYEGEALSSTLEEVGLVPSGVVLLQKVTSRGLVTQGRRRARNMIRYLQTRNEPEPELEQLWQDFSRHMNTNLTYEELVELEDSIGRVNVGVPEATIANLPTHTVSRSAGDICIVCLSEMVEGEEVMLLPCLHTFHPACIRQWLLQSTCCPTCKHYIT